MIFGFWLLGGGVCHRVGLEWALGLESLLAILWHFGCYFVGKRGFKVQVGGEKVLYFTGFERNEIGKKSGEIVGAKITERCFAYWLQNT